MRHLTERFALSALGRGVQIEQFLGGVERLSVRGIRWVEIVPRDGRYGVYLSERSQTDREDLFDVVAFPPFDGDDENDEWRQLAVADDPAAALALAAQLVGADPARWVNCGMAGDEYRDYVQGGRQDLRATGSAAAPTSSDMA